MSKGFALACESIFPGSPASHPDLKGCAAGAPSVTDRRGGSGRGGQPPLAPLHGCTERYLERCAVALAVMVGSNGIAMARGVRENRSTADPWQVTLPSAA